LPEPNQSGVADFVREAARQIALPIRSEDFEHVTEDMVRIAAIADFLMQFALAQEIEAAPVFQP